MAAVIGGLGLPAGAAAAPTLTRTGDVLTYSGDNESDGLDITYLGTESPPKLRLRPTLDNIEAWSFPGTCTQAPDRTVTCSNVPASAQLVLNTAGDDDFVNAAGAGIRMTFLGGPGDDTFMGGAAGDDAVGDSGDDSLFGNGGNDGLAGDRSDAVTGGNDQLTGGPGDDRIEGGPGSDVALGGNDDDRINLGPGRDRGFGEANADTITGGTGSDTIDGGLHDDSLDGGEDRDILTPGAGVDSIVGGSGFDVVSYAERTSAQPVVVTLDGGPNDGERNEGDNVDPSVEDVTGGAGADHLVGSDSANILAGGPGDDRLDGGGRVDQYIAGPGNDTILARDGNRESLDCDGGDDAATGDDIDVLAECERPDLSGELVSDADGDGISRPADCNDDNSSIRPGATEVPDNGVDEDCDNADATNPDRDGDGSPRPADCDDGNASRRPGAEEIVGNAVDEDCDQLANPFPSILSSVTHLWAVYTTHTQATAFHVRNLPARSRVRVRCRGRGCPERLIRRNIKKRTSRLNLTRKLRRAKLKPGAQLTIRVTRKGHIGKEVRIRIRERAVPDSETLCLPPGARKAKEC